MSVLDQYAQEDLDGLDELDGYDEFDFEDEEAGAVIAGSALGGGVGNLLGGLAADKAHAAALKVLGGRGGQVGARAEQRQRHRDAGITVPMTARERAYLKLKDESGKKKFRTFAEGAGNVLGSVAGGALGALASALPIFEDADPYEPEYSAEDIDAMEAFAEEAVEAEGEDAVIAADEMVAKGFGVMRAAARMRPVIAAVAARVRQLSLAAKRDPRYRTLARIAPLALRRTAATLMQMAAAGRPVSPQIALMVFGRVLTRLARQPQTRAAALRQAQVRARRHRMRQGAPAPVAARRPVAATPGAMRRLPRPYA